MLQAYLPNVEAVYTSPEAYHAVSCPFSCRRLVRFRQVKNCFAQTDKALRDSRIYEPSGVGFSSQRVSAFDGWEVNLNRYTFQSYANGKSALRVAASEAECALPGKGGVYVAVARPGGIPCRPAPVA